MEVNVDAVEADEEVDEGLPLLGGDVGEEGLGDRLAGGEGFRHGDVEHERLGVDISDIDTTLVGEEDGVALALGGDADVVLGVGGVGQEGLDDKVVQSARNRFDLGDDQYRWIGADHGKR